MSFNIVIDKLLLSAKEELKKEETISKLRNDIIKPIVEQIFDIMYHFILKLAIIL